MYPEYMTIQGKDYKINTDILIVGDDNCKNFLHAELI